MVQKAEGIGETMPITKTFTKTVTKTIREHFFNKGPFEEQDYHRGRNLSILEGCTARAVFNLTSGAFLAGYASLLGADDSFNGILGAVPVLAGIVQLFSPLYFERQKKRKAQAALLNFLHRFMLGLLVFIPLIATGKSERLALLFGIYLLAYMAVSFANPAASGIVIDLTPENIRGNYFGRRESFVTATAMVIGLAMGRVMDIYRSGGNEFGGFAVTFSVIIVLSFFNYLFWSSIKEPPVERVRKEYRIRQVLTLPLKNRDFRKIVIFFVLYNIGLQIAGPFFSVYMVTRLKLDYTYIMLMGTLGTIVNIFLVRLWGKLADKKSWDFVLKYSLLLLGFTHFTWFFVNNTSGFLLIPLLHITSGAAWAGIIISTFNIQFTYSPEEGRTVYIGFNQALGGIVGFSGTLVGSVLLVVFERMGLHIASFRIGGMQLLFSISGILLAGCAVYVHFFITQRRTVSEFSNTRSV